MPVVGLKEPNVNLCTWAAGSDIEDEGECVDSIVVGGI